MNSAQQIDILIRDGLAERHRKERCFRAFGLASIAFAATMLALLLVSILGPGLSGFMRHELRIDVANSMQTDYYKITDDALLATLPGTKLDPAERHQLFALAGTFAAFDVRNSSKFGTHAVWVPLSTNADLWLKGKIAHDGDKALRPLSDRQVAWIDQWQRDGRIRRSFNWSFFTHGDSRAPEAAGFGGAIVGSLLTLIICLGLALPIAIAAAITLEEFAGKSRLSGWLEVTINNLAAVPSILYGLLGLSVFLQLLHLPRSSALVGGLTLAALILPVMIIAARSAIRAVPPSMRLAAAGLGATPLQVVRDHVLPYAWPGIMTGTILSICRALGETAPLLMIGMVAFVADVPHGFTDPATSMPVEVYLWASSPEQGFLEKTSAGILVLLLILLLLNLAAIRLRNRKQLTWN